MDSSEVKTGHICKGAVEKALSTGAGRDTTVSAMQTTYHALQIQEEADRWWSHLQAAFPEGKKKQVRRNQIRDLCHAWHQLEEIPEVRRRPWEEDRLQVF